MALLRSIFLNSVFCIALMPGLTVAEGFFDVSESAGDSLGLLKGEMGEYEYFGVIKDGKPAGFGLARGDSRLSIFSDSAADGLEAIFTDGSGWLVLRAKLGKGAPDFVFGFDPNALDAADGYYSEISGGDGRQVSLKNYRGFITFAKYNGGSVKSPVFKVVRSSQKKDDFWVYVVQSRGVGVEQGYCISFNEKKFYKCIIKGVERELIYLGSWIQ